MMGSEEQSKMKQRSRAKKPFFAMLFVAIGLVFCMAIYSAFHTGPRLQSTPNLLVAYDETDHLPYVGNGYLATIVESDTIHIAGFYSGSGIAADDASHRAAIPSCFNPMVHNAKRSACALDIEKGTYSCFSEFKSVSINQTIFAHRDNRHLLVHALTMQNKGPTSVTLQIQRDEKIDCFSSDDLHFSSVSEENGDIFVFVSNAEPEREKDPLTWVAYAFTNVTQQVTIPSNTSVELVFHFYAKTNLPNDGSSNKYRLMSEVKNEYKNIRQQKLSSLLDSHIDAWVTLWQSGIDIDHAVLAPIVNASLYAILSSVRKDWIWSLSPGSLSTSAYEGHVFWDCETWMFPTIAVLYPDIAQTLLQYRFDRVDEAAKKARSYKRHYKGYMFPWESSVTGMEVGPVAFPSGANEHHISGDIAFAIKQLYYLTRNEKWMREDAWDALHGICTFIESRVTYVKAGSGQDDDYYYSVIGVMGADEFADNVTDNAFTNGVFATALRFCSEVGSSLNLSISANWSVIADRLRFPLSKTSPVVHLEYENYKLYSKVKQADVVLLGFPLELPMENQLRQNDLNFYSTVTDPNGPAMTFSMHAISWLELKDTAKASADLLKSYRTVQGPFHVWVESLSGGANQFITGAGGFLQIFTFGYTGMRLREDHLLFDPQLPPDSTRLSVRGIHYSGLKFDLIIYSATVTLTLQQRHHDSNGKHVQQPVDINLCIYTEFPSDPVIVRESITISRSSFMIKTCSKNSTHVGDKELKMQ